MIAMKKFIHIPLFVVFLSCTQKKDSPNTTSDWNPDFSGFCGYVTIAELEEALGTALAGMPEEITDDYRGGFGCSFAGKADSRGEHFGYIIFPTSEAFYNMHPDAPYPGVGDEAFLLNAPDAQQLWVREDERYVVVALGDMPRPEKCAKLARLILERLKTKPLNAL
jgi:hypothetical protein